MLVLRFDVSFQCSLACESLFPKKRRGTMRAHGVDSVHVILQGLRRRPQVGTFFAGIASLGAGAREHRMTRNGRKRSELGNCAECFFFKQAF